MSNLVPPQAALAALHQQIAVDLPEVPVTYSSLIFRAKMQGISGDRLSQVLQNWQGPLSAEVEAPITFAEEQVWWLQKMRDVADSMKALWMAWPFATTIFFNFDKMKEGGLLAFHIILLLAIAFSSIWLFYRAVWDLPNKRLDESRAPIRRLVEQNGFINASSASRRNWITGRVWAGIWITLLVMSCASAIAGIWIPIYSLLSMSGGTIVCFLALPRWIDFRICKLSEEMQ